MISRRSIAPRSSFSLAPRFASSPASRSSSLLARRFVSPLARAISLAALALAPAAARAQQAQTPVNGEVKILEPRLEPAKPPPRPEPTQMQGGPLPAYSSVGGEELEPAERVTFEQALQRAKAQNSNARIAEEEIARAEALVREAQAAWLPTLTGTANYTRLEGDRTEANPLGGPPIIVLPENSLNLSATLAMPLFAPKQWLASRRAKITADSYRFQEADVLRQLALSTGRAYLSVVEAHRQLEVADRARNNAKDHDDYAQERLRGGLGNRLDAVRSAQDLATTDVALRNQLVALSRAREALGILLSADAPVDAADIPALPAPPSLKPALEEAKSRPDVAAAEARFRAADQQVQDSWSLYAPILTAAFTPFYQDPAETSVPTTGWSGSLVLSVPFYDGGLRYGQIREYKALAAEAREQLEAQLRQAGSDVRAAYQAMVHADEALDSAHRAAQLATEALKLAEDAYHAGAVTNLDVLDAERVQRDTAADEANAEDASRQARLELLAAAGKL